MKLSKLNIMSLMVATGIMLGSSFAPAQAANPYYGYAGSGYGPYYGNGYGYGGSAIGNFFYNHPYVQKAVLVGGAGAAVGALTAPDGYRGQGAAKGAMVGAGAGMGYEFLRERGIIPW